MGFQPCNISRQEAIKSKIADSVLSVMFYTAAFYYVGVL